MDCPKGEGAGHAWSITQESFGRLSLECSWCGQLASAEGQSEGKFIDLTLRRPRYYEDENGDLIASFD